MDNLTTWQQRWNIPDAAMRDLKQLFIPDDNHTGARSEAATSKSCERSSGTHRQRLWRNNSGAATCERTGRLIRYGLGHTSHKTITQFKSSDYIGITTVTVQPWMVGQSFGIFTALEMKAPNWRLTPGDERGQAQANFLTMVTAAGGIASFITHPEQYVTILKNWGILSEGGTP